jgi:thioredoxin:protein disulfide reductase
MRKGLLSLLMLISSALFAQPLPVDQAFKLSVQTINQKLFLNWRIAPGYYLYRDRISFKTIQKLPPGIPKFDAHLGSYEVYENQITLPLDQIQLPLTVRYQGCAKAGFCYPPVTRYLVMGSDHKITVVDHAPQKNTMTRIFSNDGQKIAVANLLDSHNLWFLLLGFFGIGLLLSLTPCVLPLIPVISAIVLGQKSLTSQKAFRLSACYVTAMALTYSLAGIMAGLAGSYLQAFLQNPWMIITVSVIFIMLALSLFGVYEFKLPQWLELKLTRITQKQTGGRYLGVAAMGCLSTLVISPCVTVPLLGVLTYISTSGNAVLGGLALFMLGLGSGTPLLLIGTSAGKYIPRSGPWMQGIKILLGVLLIGMAIGLLTRIMPISEKTPENQGNFTMIKSPNDLQRILIQAKQQKRLLLLDFSARWCIACQHIDQTIFKDPKIQTLLKNFILARADLTANDALDRALQKQLNVIGPPTMIFFNSEGKELTQQRIVGEISGAEFISHLKTIYPT